MIGSVDTLSKQLMSRLQDGAQERPYAALLRLELNGSYLRFEIESDALNSRDFSEGLS